MRENTVSTDNVDFQSTACQKMGYKLDFITDNIIVAGLSVM